MINNNLILNFNTHINTSKAFADGQLRKLSRKMESLQEVPLTPAKQLFKVRRDNLESELVTVSKSKGGLELNKVYDFRLKYIERETRLDSNFSDYNLKGLAMVFDNVVGKALSQQAKTMDSETANAWDDEIHDLNHKHEVFISASTIVGGTWEPCSLTELAPFDTAYTSVDGIEPYAGTEAKDFF
jgi:hypothetical protein